MNEVNTLTAIRIVNWYLISKKCAVLSRRFKCFDIVTNEGDEKFIKLQCLLATKTFVIMLSLTNIIIL